MEFIITYIIIGLITAALFVSMVTHLGLIDSLESAFPNKLVFVLIWVVIWPWWVVKFIYEVVRPRK